MHEYRRPNRPLPWKPAREYPPEERVVRFFFEDGHEWGLYEDATDEYTMYPEDYDLSPEMIAQLQKCRALWLRRDLFTGTWDPPEAERQCAEEFERTFKMLRTELYPIRIVRE